MFIKRRAVMAIHISGKNNRQLNDPFNKLQPKD